MKLIEEEPCDAKETNRMEETRQTRKNNKNVLKAER